MTERRKQVPGHLAQTVDGHTAEVSAWGVPRSTRKGRVS